jgi:hypothetical protein
VLGDLRLAKSMTGHGRTLTRWRCIWLVVISNLPALGVSAATRHVWQQSPTPQPPFETWVTAAHTIQEAVDVAQAGDTVLVVGGFYDIGGRAVHGTLTNRLTIDKAVLVQGLMGPEATVIAGTSEDRGAVRGVYVGVGAVLSGFTVTNGHTRAQAELVEEQSGGGIWCEVSGMVSNCIVVGNAASWGGGVYGGTLYNCTLEGNTARESGGGVYRAKLFACALLRNSAWNGGGAYGGTLENCTLASNSADFQGGGGSDCALTNCTLVANAAVGGGGAYAATLARCTVTGNRADLSGGGTLFGTLHECTLTDNQANGQGGGTYGGTVLSCALVHNTADLEGGGAFFSTMRNCSLRGNQANEQGGGAFGGTLYNCTLTDNSAGEVGGGISGSRLVNCVAHFNTAPSGPNYSPDSTIAHSCTWPLPGTGTGNITSEPAFVNRTTGNLRLRYGSPCIDAGTNLSALIKTDLDGLPRPLDGNGDGAATFDIGVYEYYPQTADSNEDGISDQWCLNYGFDPNDPNLAAENPDQDFYTNEEEWVADTNPTNANSRFRILSMSSGPPARLFFHSSSNRLYSLEFCTDLANLSWTVVPGQVNVPGNGHLHCLSDPSPAQTRFYRVRVSVP